MCPDKKAKYCVGHSMVMNLTLIIEGAIIDVFSPLAVQLEFSISFCHLEYPVNLLMCLFAPPFQFILMPVS